MTERAELQRELQHVKAQRDELRRRVQIAEGRWQRARLNLMKLIDKLLMGETDD